MLSLCLVALPAKAAFATEAAQPATATEESTPEIKELYNKQIEIDQLLEDNAKNIEEKGFMVNSTAVVDNAIEIAISPYKEEYADYIYELVGKEKVNIIEMDQSILYSSSAAPDQATGGEATDDGKVYKGDATDDGKVYKGDATETATDGEPVTTTGISDQDDTMEIQIESVDNPEAIENLQDVKTTSVNEEDIRTLSAENTEAKDQKSSAPTTVIAIAVGAALLGSAVTLTAKKKRK